MGLKELLTKDNADKVAKHIVNCIRSSDGEHVDLDCEFQMLEGEFITDDVNTWIKFDLHNDLFLQELKDIQTAMYSDTKGRPDSELRAKANLFDTWIKLVSSLLETKYKKQVTGKIRQHLLPNTDEHLMPMDKIKIQIIEISEFGDSPIADKLMNIEKLVNPKDPESPSLASEIYALVDETGMMPDEIIEKKKAEGDPNYENVVGVQLNKHFYEVNIELFVDYSLNPETKPKEGPKQL